MFSNNLNLGQFFFLFQKRLLSSGLVYGNSLTVIHHGIGIYGNGAFYKVFGKIHTNSDETAVISMVLDKSSPSALSLAFTSSYDSQSQIGWHFLKHDLWIWLLILGDAHYIKKYYFRDFKAFKAFYYNELLERKVNLTACFNIFRENVCHSDTCSGSEVRET